MDASLLLITDESRLQEKNRSQNIFKKKKRKTSVFVNNTKSKITNKAYVNIFSLKLFQYSLLRMFLQKSHLQSNLMPY